MKRQALKEVKKSQHSQKNKDSLQTVDYMTGYTSVCAHFLTLNRNAASPHSVCGGTQFSKNCEIYYCYVAEVYNRRQDMAEGKKTIKFHGLAVANVIVRYSQREEKNPDTIKMEEFDAAKDPQICETVNIQVVSDFVTITFYKNESENLVIRRELIPSLVVEHIWISDLQE
jgi:hypothetical protein